MAITGAFYLIIVSATPFFNQGSIPEGFCIHFYPLPN
jgi:hypothetical protein